MDNTIQLNKTSNDFLNQLATAKQNGSRSSMLQIAASYSQSEQFINSIKKLNPQYAEFYLVIFNNYNELNAELVQTSFENIFKTTPSGLINTDAFKQLQNQVTNSLVAATINSSVTSSKRSFIVYLAYTLEIIQKLANNSSDDFKNIFKSKILLPEGMFPLPLVDASLAESRKNNAANRKQILDSNNAKILAQTNTLTLQNNAVKEIINAFQTSTLTEPTPPKGVTTPTKPTGGFKLSAEAFKNLSTETKTVLKNVGISDEEIDIVRSISLLEKKSAEVAQQLYSGPTTSRNMVRIGNVLLPDTAILRNPVLAVNGTATSQGVAGPCPPQAIDSNLPEDNNNVTVPYGHGEARILGVADLMIVEQELLRYELGEIAYIENVLKSEVRERKFLTSQKTTTVTSTETEETDKQEKDLSSTDKYELQTEAQKVISDNSSKDAGITLTGSYGPTINVTANYNSASSNATQDSKSSSSNFARDTTSRAVSSLEKRTLTKRSVTTVDKIKEINKHSFDNKDGTDNITGVYRWIDKYYSAQIVNYGKRLMLEFIVPEPAAFMRYSLAKQPVEDITFFKPDPPGYCLSDGQTFAPLKVQDITPDNFLNWVSKYGVQDATPPPESCKIFSASKTNGDVQSKQITAHTSIFESVDDFGVDIEDGYLPDTANIVRSATYNNSDTGLLFTLLIQDNILDVSSSSSTSLFGERYTVTLNKQPVTSVPITILQNTYFAYEVIVNIICFRSDSKMQQWQLATYNSIMNAYNDQKSKYDNAIAAAKIRAGYSQIQGKNPLINRETEKIELKRGAISLLTGQRFELFDAMNQNVAPYGYPEIDFNEAKAEGQYIEFFEEAFEWTNITYVFYPYFWSRKDEWVTLSKLDDNDPLFARFLQAGAARVQVPVRLGFETSMLHYLEIGELWNAEGTLINTDDGQPDPLHVSVLEELKNQLGNNNYDGTGNISVTNDSDAVTGAGTVFTTDDETRRIIVGGVTYVIKKVTDDSHIQLRTNYIGNTDTDLNYAFGAKLVGDPWEVKLPTDLVKIDKF